jgi:hypothetical protein
MSIPFLFPHLISVPGLPFARFRPTSMTFPLLVRVQKVTYIIQRVETPLGNLRSGDDPNDMCYSTPAVIHGQSYNGPNAGCVDWVCSVITFYPRIPR